jgi:hypothetical protein
MNTKQLCRINLLFIEIIYLFIDEWWREDEMHQDDQDTMQLDF